MCMPRNLTFYPLHYCPVDVDRGVLPLLFPEVHNHLLCFVDVECEVIFLTPHSEGPHLLPVGRLVVVGNQAYHCSVVCKLNDSVGGVHGHAVVGEQGVQERAQNAPLWGPSVEDQWGGDVVTYPHHLGAAHQEVQYSVAQGGVETQGLELDDEFGGYYGVKC
uniref:CA protein n=1 Tax=Schistosoma japonicum TaxID=6182 RepID=Q8MUP3_SCHJA|nr:CA protein [Schistosoma japonicum]